MNMNNKLFSVLEVFIIVAIVLGLVCSILTSNVPAMCWCLATLVSYILLCNVEKLLLLEYEESAAKDRAYDRLRNSLRETQETLRVTRNELGQERETSEKLREEIARLSKKKKE